MMKKKIILVTGGAGFIGSHVVKLLSINGFELIVLDDLSRGHESAVKYGSLIKGDMGDANLLKQLFTSYSISAVMHFAACIDVGESVRDPAKYYHNNVFKTSILLKTMMEHHIRHFVFSSTAAIFGQPSVSFVDENHPANPLNPYGHSKWLVEQLLSEWDKTGGLKYSSLRYFNAAGGDPDKEIKNHQLDGHNLIPKILLSIKRKERGPLTINGSDYPTIDGTCVRDYIHVNDLGDAHIRVLKALLEGGGSTTYNLGSGKGFSVKEVIQAAEEVLGVKIPFQLGKRREGDAAQLLADSSKASKELSWKPTYTLHQMIEHAWHSY